MIFIYYHLKDCKENTNDDDILRLVEITVNVEGRID